MSSLHVGIIAFDWYPFHPRVRCHAEAAVDAGYTVDVICPRQPHEKRYEVYNGVHIYRVPMKRRFGSSLPTTIFSWCWFLLLAGFTVTWLHLKRPYNVIHVHNLPDFLVFSTLLPKLLRTKIILDVQDISPELMAVKSKGRLSQLMRFLATFQERISTSFADHVITVGEPFAESLLKRGVPREKLTIIPNSTDAKLFPSSRRSVVPLVSIEAERPFILMYHGTVAERFGLDTAIRALALACRAVPQVRLDIKGIGEDLPIIKQLAVELGVSDRVVFSDPCPIEEVVGFVAHGDVGIIPYRCDGFADLALPTKAFEFAWMHRPMIASDMRGIRSVFRPESIALCDSSNPESFAAAIIDLYQHPEKRARMVVNAAEDYIPFRWEVMAERYRQLLALLGQKQVKKQHSTQKGELSIDILVGGTRRMQQIGKPSSDDHTFVEAHTDIAQTGKALASTEYSAKIAGRDEVKPSTLLVISVQPTAMMRAEIAAGKQPRRDYEALQQEMGADVIYPDDAQMIIPMGRLIRRLFGARTLVALAAFCRHQAYDYILSDTEGVGLPLAMLMKLNRTRPGHPHHTLIAQYLTPFKKRIFFRLGVGSHLDTISVHSSAQYAFAIDVLKMPSEHMIKLPMFAETQFWRPSAASATNIDTSTITGQRPMIFSAGGERRDYPTLLTAVEGLDVDVYIAAASAAAFHKNAADHRSRPPRKLSGIPSNVFVKACNFAEMRELYAAARFVVVPVVETNDSAGLTVILEAMAMGKAVIVSGTRGQTDVIRDPRNDGRGPIVREWWPGFVDNPRVAETLGRLPTGFYVTPGDPNELRDIIQYLLDHPEVAEELGRNGRRVAEEYLSLEVFVKRYAAAIRGEPQPAEYF